MRAFAEGRLSDYLDGRLLALKNEVNAEQRNRLLNVNEDKYVEYLAAKYAVQQLEIDWENPSVTDRETMVPAERFPPDFFVDPGKSYKRQSITYHYPIAGDTELLRLAPSRGLLWSAEVEDSESEIRISLINFRDDPKEIKRSQPTLFVISANSTRTFEPTRSGSTVGLSLLPGGGAHEEAATPRPTGPAREARRICQGRNQCAEYLRRSGGEVAPCDRQAIGSQHRLRPGANT